MRCRRSIRREKNPISSTAFITLSLSEINIPLTRITKPLLQTYYNNGDYFVSIVNTMTGKNSGISIVAKDLTAPTFDTTVAKYNAAFWAFVVLIPAAVLITGIVIWLRRRHR